jgi:hypothetical protein
MLESAGTSMAAVVAVAVGLAACSQRETVDARTQMVVTAAGESAACVGDSLRPATASPAQGLWGSDSLAAGSGRVVVLIGPPGSSDLTLTVTRLVESLEISPAGDTIRNRRAAVSVSLELLPAPGADTLGEAKPGSRAGAHPAATYVLSSRVQLAAYEACATSTVGPRVRYVRRDASGRIVTDVMLHRTSEQ